jgi:hypothetical protein
MTMIQAAFVLIGGALMAGVLVGVGWVLLTRLRHRDQDQRPAEREAAAPEAAERGAAARKDSSSHSSGERRPRREFVTTAARADCRDGGGARLGHGEGMPALLREVKASQRKGERHRRWFSNADFDLIVWFEPLDTIAGFELCYDRSAVERALSWSATHGYRHWRVDTGEASGYMHSMTPIMERDDVTRFPKDRVVAAFVGAAAAIDPMVRSFVIQRLREVARAETGESRSHTGRAEGGGR